MIAGEKDLKYRLDEITEIKDWMIHQHWGVTFTH